MTAKATVDSVRLEMISEMDISFPKSEKEQQLLADYLTQLDNLITLHQREQSDCCDGCQESPDRERMTRSTS